MKPSQAHRGKLYPCKIQNVKLFLALTTILFIIDPTKGYTQGNQAPGRNAGQPVADTSLSTQIPSEGLQIGDKIPDKVWNLPLQVVNHPGGKEAVTLSDFKGKLIVLDFWATWCSPCVAAFPKLESLQKQFSDRLRILPVARQDKKTVNSFLGDMNSVRDLTFISITSDTILHKLFTHSYIPHYVWIDSAGVVQGITGGDAVTDANIQSILRGKGVEFDMKRDIRRRYDDSTPLMSGINSVKKDEILYHSVLTRFIEGYSGRKTNDTHKIRCLNSTIKSLFQYAYGEFKSVWTSQRVLIETKDTTWINSGLRGRDYIKWLRENGYCYELIVPDTYAGNKFELMRADLDRYFPTLKCSIEKRRVKCLVLVRTTSKDKIGSNGGKSKMHKNAYSFSLQNNQWGWFPVSLHYFWQHLRTPLIDETGYKGRMVDLDIAAKMSSVEEVKKELHKYGLDVIRAEREIDMIVIKDRDLQDRKHTRTNK